MVQKIESVTHHNIPNCAMPASRTATHGFIFISFGEKWLRFCGIVGASHSSRESKGRAHNAPENDSFTNKKYRSLNILFI